MQFTAYELAIASGALRTTGQLSSEGRPMGRTFDNVDEQKDGVSIVQKLDALVEEDRFIDGALDLSTTEKALLLKLLNCRGWAIDDCKYKLSLEEKIK